MVKAGMMEISWIILFQIINITVLIGIIYAVFYVLVKLPKRMKEIEQKIDTMEKALNEINIRSNNK